MAMLMTLLVFAAVIGATVGFMYLMIKVPMIISERNTQKAAQQQPALKQKG